MMFLQTYSGAFSFIATAILVLLTGFYAYWTKGILKATLNQSKLAQAPVIGISIKKIWISEVFGPDRRNMNVDLEIINVGNAPAIEVLIDAEIEYRYSKIGGKNNAPARFESEMIPYVKPGDTAETAKPNFGNKAILHFFDDVREANRLNLHRIQTKPTQSPFKTSKLTVFAYYRNSFDQWFMSSLETEICIWKMLGEELIPKDDESIEVTQSNIPRKKFHSGVIDHSIVDETLKERDSRRNDSGW